MPRSSLFRTTSASASLTRLAIVAAFGLASAIAMLAPATAADFTKEQLAAARAALEASHVTDGFDNILFGVAEQTKAGMIKASPNYHSQIEAATTKVAVQLASERVDLDRQVQQIWASKFTVAELQEIARFYSSPVGEKLSKETNGLAQASVQAMQAYQQKLSQDMFIKVRDELKKQGLPF